GKIVLGVVYDPFREELFQAVKGNGAHLNGQIITVSMTPVLSHALLATGFPYDRSTLDPVLERFGRLTRLSQAIRRDGAAALNLCYVACGRFDGFWEGTLQPWDAAAGALIVREAGGVVSNYTGAPWSLVDCPIVAANSSSLLQEILSALA
ncbi:MAG: inositol monophosphatase, partial [Chloroflexi bacterium]|nr:inositol monophosphatase [Chloroflexota bacterium]